ncbi:WD40-repeat-containing domain protein [Pavlovales sp. CCMP2436]|nr:WD40-repeat-containing domain protein [Pavlovales sp. CCMP2436]|mmetsp:Transcript_16513/g.42124  ORF Transcript_16513/g.42124 Transcript_16513/m.42124 type:complete len:376 (-) Transcript_16513:57-1184(-)
MGCTLSRAAGPTIAHDRQCAYGAGGVGEAAVPMLDAVHTDIVNCLAPGPAPSQWLSCAQDRAVVLYCASTHKVLERWEGHARGVNRVAALRGGDEAVVSASRDCTLKLWRRGQAEAVATLAGHTLTVSAVCAPSDSVVISASRDTSVRSWDVRTGQQVGAARISRNLATFLASCEAEPQLVVQGSEDLRVRVWDLRTMAVATTFEGLQYFALCGSMTADGYYVLAGCNGFSGSGCELKLFDRRRAGLVVQVRPHQHAVTACAFLPHAETGGLAGASASKDGSVCVVDFLAAAGGGEAGDSGVVLYAAQPTVGGQLTSLAAVDALSPPGADAGAAAAGLVVGTARGSVHSFALDASTGVLRELCYTQPEPEEAADE